MDTISWIVIAVVVVGAIAWVVNNDPFKINYK